MSRLAPEICRSYTQRSNLGPTEGGNWAGDPGGNILVPDAWVINPLRGEYISVLDASYSTAPISVSAIVTAGGFASVPLYRAPSNSGAGSVSSGSVSGWQFRPTAGSSWNQQLAADAAAFLSPVIATPLGPMDRKILGLVSYGENTGYHLAFRLPKNWVGLGAFMTFMYGGHTATFPADAGISGAGTFAVTFYGNGTAEVYELLGDPSVLGSWKRVFDFRWSEPHRVTTAFHNVSIMPYLADRTLFTSRSNDDVQGPSVFQAGMANVRKGVGTQSVFYDTKHLTGHTHTRAQTGAGVIRLDLLRNFRPIVALARLVYSPLETLRDGPFHFKSPMPENTPITLTPIAFDTFGGGVFTRMYAIDGTALGQDSNGNFLSRDGEQAYYVEFDLHSSPDHFQSPALLGYVVKSDGLISSLSPTSVSTIQLQSLNMTGPDLTPEHETAELLSRDIKATQTILRTRDRIPCDIKVNNTGDPRGFSYLMRGETWRIPGLKMGRDTHNQGAFQTGPTSTWPNTNWYDYRIRVKGEYYRVENQKCVGYWNFQFNEENPIARDSDTGRVLPWKITDIIKLALKNCGYDDADIDVPDSNMRLEFTPFLGKYDYAALPTTQWMRLAIKMARMFLGKVLLFDRNVGATGKWRVIDNPTNHDNVVAYFRKTPISTAGAKKNIMRVGVITPGQTNEAHIIDESFHEYIKAPEGNIVVVTAPGFLLPQGGGMMLFTSTLINKDSFDIDPDNPTADPNHPDYLGHEEPIYHIDPFLRSQAACDEVCRRIFDFACHAEKWVEWNASLLFVNDPLDTSLGTNRRPLRVNDVVAIDGNYVVLRNVNPFYEHDGIQEAYYEGVYMS